MTIGLPRALLYFKYRHLWETFFKELGCDIILSPETNRQILEDGISFSIDECCLPSKIYMGHVYWLIGKCDYILVPRVENFGKKEKVCVKFNAMYDIVKNTFEEAPLLDYNIDLREGENELKGFIRMGKALGHSIARTLPAYRKAKNAQRAAELREAEAQGALMEDNGTLKILIVTHPYNIYDKLIGAPVVKLIENLGGTPIFADGFMSRECVKKSAEISKHLYWTYNKELVGAVGLCKDRVDGLIFLTAFPCGPDSLVNELVIRRLRDVPMANIILDELTGEAGLQTRIESFMDILGERKRLRVANG